MDKSIPKRSLRGLLYYPPWSTILCWLIVAAGAITFLLTSHNANDSTQDILDLAKSQGTVADIMDAFDEVWYTTIGVCAAVLLALIVVALFRWHQKRVQSKFSSGLITSHAYSTRYKIAHIVSILAAILALLATLWTVVLVAFTAVWLSSLTTLNDAINNVQLAQSDALDAMSTISSRSGDVFNTFASDYNLAYNATNSIRKSFDTALKDRLDFLNELVDQRKVTVEDILSLAAVSLGKDKKYDLRPYLKVQQFGSSLCASNLCLDLNNYYFLGSKQCLCSKTSLQDAYSLSKDAKSDLKWSLVGVGILSFGLLLSALLLTASAVKVAKVRSMLKLRSSIPQNHKPSLVPPMEIEAIGNPQYTHPAAAPAPDRSASNKERKIMKDRSRKDKDKGRAVDVEQAPEIIVADDAPLERKDSAKRSKSRRGEEKFAVQAPPPEYDVDIEPGSRSIDAPHPALPVDVDATEEGGEKMKRKDSKKKKRDKDKQKRKDGEGTSTQVEESAPSATEDVTDAHMATAYDFVAQL